MMGCSLPTRFVADRPPHRGQSADWAGMYGGPDACLTALGERGVSSVELRDIRARTGLDDVARAIAKVLEHSMAVTLHLWLPHDIGDLDGVLRLADGALADTRAPVPCALHPHYATYGIARAEALRTTTVALTALCDVLAHAGSPVLPALELCRQRAGGPVGITFDELLGMRNAVSARNLGLCWDVGHGFANHRAGLAPLAPEGEFVSAVVHTHLHDLDASGSTHGPLRSTEGNAADAIRRLAHEGYRGIYDLELEPGRWALDDAARRHTVEASFDVLAQILADAAGRPDAREDAKSRT